MNKLKSKLVITIILAIVFISSSYITLDWARLYVIKDALIYERLLFTSVAKFLVVILSTILVFIIGSDGISTIDSRKLKIIYIFIILADISLGILPNAVVGILIFSIVQIGLISRNGSGIFKKIKEGELKLLQGRIFINTILSTLLGLVILFNLFSSLLNNSILLIFMISYGIILSISLLVAIANPILGLFPRINSILVSVGMVLFVLCDLNVGLSLVLKSGTEKIVADSIIWVFYTPALLLIALSGYDYSHKKWML